MRSLPFPRDLVPIREQCAGMLLVVAQAADPSMLAKDWAFDLMELFDARVRELIEESESTRGILP